MRFVGAVIHLIFAVYLIELILRLRAPAVTLDAVPGVTLDTVPGVTLDDVRDAVHDGVEDVIMALLGGDGVSLIFDIDEEPA